MEILKLVSLIAIVGALDSPESAQIDSLRRLSLP